MDHSGINPLFPSSPVNSTAASQKKRTLAISLEDSEQTSKVRRAVNFQQLFGTYMEKGAEIPCDTAQLDDAAFDSACQQFQSYQLPGATFKQKADFVAQLHIDPYIRSTIFEGAYSIPSIKGFLDAIKLFLNYPLFQSVKDKLLTLQAQLHQLLDYTDALNNLKTAADFKQWAQDMIEIIWNMKPGEEILLPGGWEGKPGHSMIHHLIRNDDLSYTQIVYNAGSGGEVYHPSESGSKKIKIPREASYSPLLFPDLFFSENPKNAQPFF